MTNFPAFVRETIRISKLMKKIGEPLSSQQEGVLLEAMLEIWHEKERTDPACFAEAVAEAMRKRSE